MQEIRCGSCSRKLGTGTYICLTIKCPRCGTLNHLMATSHEPERPGAPSIEEMNASKLLGCNQPQHRSERVSHGRQSVRRDRRV
ncbi:Com family DNA-binding transcriptional regulator [Delftia lacustris]